MRIDGVKTGFPQLDLILAEILSLWPQHERYLRKNISERDFELLEFSELLSQIISKKVSFGRMSLASLAADYRFLCESIVLPEELFFRRHGRYRLSSFEEADKTVYSDREFMTKYMNGLLLSDVIWVNHCRCMMNYSKVFLEMLTQGSRLLEIGPGHGLLLYLATLSSNVASINAWDVSDASLKLAEETITCLSTTPVSFEKRNIYDHTILTPQHSNSFDAIVLSEVLEHLERPFDAIKVLYHLAKPGGLVWINVPANSPAPDHLYLVTDIAEPIALLKEGGFEIEATFVFPTTGATVETAKAKKLTSNCVIIGRKP
jgi:2-polyprenyl-3-methyl-5-hydroxy-6-metoxy-1,4-benzoquinol methylase